VEKDNLTLNFSISDLYKEEEEDAQHSSSRLRSNERKPFLRYRLDGLFGIHRLYKLPQVLLRFLWYAFAKGEGDPIGCHSNSVRRNMTEFKVLFFTSIFFLMGVGTKD